MAESGVWRVAKPVLKWIATIVVGPSVLGGATYLYGEVNETKREIAVIKTVDAQQSKDIDYLRDTLDKKLDRMSDKLDELNRRSHAP